MAHSGTIVYMRTDPTDPKARILTEPLPLKNMDGSLGEVPTGFKSDGSSSGIFEPIFPRFNHPVAFFRHDYRCERAKTAEERKWADREFEHDVGTTSWWITKKIGYLGVRAGALLGIGVNYKGD